MSLVVQHNHFMPKRWCGKEHAETITTEFETLFQYTTMMWLEEMASIFLTPYLLLFVVPKRVDDILQFVADFTVNLEGVGDVCSYSVFDFKTHAFKATTCIGNLTQGIQFLSNLENFRDQQLQEAISCNPHMTCQWSPNVTNRRTRNSHFNTGSMWLIETDPWSHPYLLDWYYTTGRPTPSSLADVHRVNVNTANGPHHLGIWIPPSLTNNEDRLSSHLDASTTTTRRFLNEQSTVENPTKSQWWARAGPVGSHMTGQMASFLDPPNFNRYLTEEEEDRSYHSLSRTTYQCEFNSGGEFKLHFDDVFRSPSEGSYTEPEFSSSDPRKIMGELGDPLFFI